MLGQYDGEGVDGVEELGDKVGDWVILLVFSTEVQYYVNSMYDPIKLELS